MPDVNQKAVGVETVPRGVNCDYPRMMCPNNATKEYPCMNPDCLHFYCPDCGLSWDDGFPP